MDYINNIAIYQDNAGYIHLFAVDANIIPVYANDYDSIRDKSLAVDVATILDGGDPILDGWESNVEDIAGAWAYIQDHLNAYDMIYPTYVLVRALSQLN